MDKKDILTLSKEGSDYSFVIPKGTKVESINEALALFLIETAKYRKISTSLALEEIRSWVTQLEEHQL